MSESSDAPPSRQTPAITWPRRENSPSATEIVAAIARGDASARAVLEAHLERIDTVEPALRAFAFVDREGARDRADELDRRGAGSGSAAGIGALHGVPFGIKDNIDTVDMPTAYGTAIHSGLRPGRDAACVAGLRLAGAIALGKTMCTEFAHRTPGPTRNPWAVEHTPGGSSSGSTAAVAAGLVTFALGSQTTGSTIRPAAYCGVVGYKPTHGVFNASGMLANAPSFDTVGVIARELSDIALVRRALLDDSVPASAPLPPKGLTFGLCRTPWWPSADAPTQRLVEAAARSLERAGAKVIDFDPPHIFAGLEADAAMISGYEFARTLAHERRCHYDELSPALRDGRMADGLEATHEQYVSAQRRVESARLELDAEFADVDAVLTPAAPGAAPRGLDSTGPAVFNLAWTTLHTPAVTIPLGYEEGSLPLGLQLVAKRFDDDRLLAIAGTVSRIFA